MDEKYDQTETAEVPRVSDLLNVAHLEAENIEKELNNLIDTIGVALVPGEQPSDFVGHDKLAGDLHSPHGAEVAKLIDRLRETRQRIEGIRKRVQL